jgi:GDPmannose 4,6-dehydratase
MIIQANKPEAWVIATGIATTIRDFVKMAFAQVGICLRFEGKGVEEKAFVLSCSNPVYQLEAVKKKFSKKTYLISDPLR